jgi:hypothetical protein
MATELHARLECQFNLAGRVLDPEMELTVTRDGAKSEAKGAGGASAAKTGKG